MHDHTAKSLCLHIGCGLVVGPSWLNLDASSSLRLVQLPLVGRWLQQRLKLPPWPPEVRYGNIVTGLAIAPNSCELVYASHVLEHLSRQDFDRALKNILSYLKPGGTLRVVVPDLEDLAQKYLADLQNPITAPQAAETLMTDSFLGHSGSRTTVRQRLKEALANHRHQWMWDRVALPWAFEQAGLDAVQVCSYGDWPDERFAEVEHPDNFQGAIAVQGMKP
ncbi:MAG: methyltransferase domain-containing protein [Spirulina sp. SIO3F2]|nr:methyltransferase domain-containing protein [Spirulina sp. SIO3F2]